MNSFCKILLVFVQTFEMPEGICCCLQTCTFIYKFPITDFRGVHRIFQKEFPKRELPKKYLPYASYPRARGARKPRAGKSVTLRGVSGNSAASQPQASLLSSHLSAQTTYHVKGA